MDPLTISAASGLRARMETLDMLANNLANAATSGFKSDREFYSLYVSPEADASGAVNGNSNVTTVPVVEKSWTDFSPGLLVPTGNKLDLALSGKGFFAANGSSGPLYTRNGNFRLSASGALVTAEGYPLLTEDGKTIQSQSDSPLEVNPDAEVRQDGQVLGKLRIVDFPANAEVVKQGSAYFQLTDPKIKLAQVSTAQVEQGKIESSNVVAAESAVRLVGVMRQFEMLQRAVTLNADMNRRAVEEVAKVTS
jgi:flagellar basal-body rod protein FlgF